MSQVVKYDVFISYARADYEDDNKQVIRGNHISRIKDTLSSAGLSYWFDEDGIFSGDTFAPLIAERIQQSGIFLFISSETSNSRYWTTAEIAVAHRYGKKIIPLKLDDSDYNTKVIMYLQPLDAIDYYKNPEKGLDRLVESIKVQLNKSDIKPLSGLPVKKRRNISLKKKSLILCLFVLFVLGTGGYFIVCNESYEVYPISIDGQRIVYKNNIPSSYTTISMRIKVSLGKAEDCFLDCSDDWLDARIEGKELIVGIQENKSAEPRYGNILVQKGESDYAALSLMQLGKDAIYTESVGSNYINGILTVDGIEYPIVKVQGGSFLMGNDYYSDQGPEHMVILSDFSIGAYEVTQELWEAVMKYNPCFHLGPKRPVEMVSWEDCQLFITKLNLLVKQKFALPTEAQWEYAAKGGRLSRDFVCSGSDVIDEVAWYNKNSDGMTHQVGLKRPNELGVYDMSGNVMEWCQDIYGTYTEEIVHDTDSCDLRVVRGGCWYNDGVFGQTEYRSFAPESAKSSNLGFRLVIEN